MKAIVLLSGGLDSATALWWAKNKYEKTVALFFEYGAKEQKTSLACAQKLAKLAGARLEKISLPWLKKYAEESGSRLVKGKPPVGQKLGKKTALKVWVPARNLVFLSIAAAKAETLGGKVDIITGFNLEEAATFPDNSKKFVQNLNKTLGQAVLKAKIKLVTPLINKDKKQIAKTAIQLKVPVEYSTSCYQPKGFDNKKRPIHCGECESCLRRKRAFGEKDPTKYVVQPW